MADSVGGQKIMGADQALDVARQYLIKMLGHAFFELETISNKLEGDHWVIRLKLAHMITKQRFRYNIFINPKNGNIEKVESAANGK